MGAFIIAVILVLIYNEFFANEKEIVGNENHKAIYKTRMLKHQILSVYNRDSFNRKRERIVELLIELYEYEDTSEFLDENSFISKFIFDNTV